MRPGREMWIVGILLLVLVAATVHFSNRAGTAAPDRPSTYSASPKGLKAVYELCLRRHVAASRYERPFDELPNDAAILIVAEPLVRPVSDAEQAALVRWVEKGGVAVVIVAGAWPQRSRNGVTFNQVGVTDTGPATGVAHLQGAPDTPYAADIAALPLTTSTRLVNEAERTQRTIFADDAGACVISWPVGSGEAIAISDALAPKNSALGNNDTALLYLNIIAAHTTPLRPRVLFDEYHQGYGEVAKRAPTLWSAVGAPFRAAAWALLGLTIIAIISANRRFGRPIVLVRHSSRPSTEYVESMAELYRRAEASGIAIELLYRPFARDLANKVDAPPDAPARDIARLAAARFGWPQSALEQLMVRCERIAEGAPVSEAEMLRLAQQMDDYRRRADLVRLNKRPVADRRR